MHVNVLTNTAWPQVLSQIQSELHHLILKWSLVAAESKVVMAKAPERESTKPMGEVMESLYLIPNYQVKSNNPSS